METSSEPTLRYCPKSRFTNQTHDFTLPFNQGPNPVCGACGFEREGTLACTGCGKTSGWYDENGRCTICGPMEEKLDVLLQRSKKRMP